MLDERRLQRVKGREPGVPIRLAPLPERAAGEARQRRQLVLVEAERVGGGRDGGRDAAQVGDVVELHADDFATEFCPPQAERRKIERASCRIGISLCGMPYDPDRIRRAIRRVMKERGLKLTPWCAQAEISKSTLRQFLDESDRAGNTRSLTIETLYKLADAAHIPVTELLGEEAEPATVETARRTALDLLQRIRREYEAGANFLARMDDLLLTLAPPEEQRPPGGAAKPHKPARSGPRSPRRGG